MAQGEVTRIHFITCAASGVGRKTALLVTARGFRVGGYDVDPGGGG